MGNLWGGILTEEQDKELTAMVNGLWGEVLPERTVKFVAEMVNRGYDINLEGPEKEGKAEFEQWMLENTASEVQWVISDGDTLQSLGANRRRTMGNLRYNTPTQWETHLTDEQKQVLSEAVRQHKRILVSGGEAEGKTELVGWLMTRIAKGERVAVIESYRELQKRFLGLSDVTYVEAVTNGTINTKVADDLPQGNLDWLIVDELQRGLLETVMQQIERELKLAVIATIISRESRTAVQLVGIQSRGLRGLTSDLEQEINEVADIFDIYVHLENPYIAGRNGYVATIKTRDDIKKELETK